jgi:hypothetical protein
MLRRSGRAERTRPSLDRDRWTAIDVSPSGDATIRTCPVRIYTSVRAITGSITGAGRLSDILNERREIRVDDAVVAVLGTSSEARTREPVMILDPFEIEIAMVRSYPDEPWTRARRVHKVRYPVVVRAQPFEIHGELHVFPGLDPAQGARTATALFIPVTSPTARRHGRLVSDPTVDTILVNRHLITEIRQVDPPGVQDAGAILARRRSAAPA